MAKKKLSNVLMPGRIGSLELRNRMVRMGAQFVPVDSDKDDGTLSSQYIRLYRDLAAGGIGLISIAGGSVDLGETDYESPLKYDTDYYIPSLSAVAETIHEQGAKVVWQVMTPGNVGASTFTKEEMVEFLLPHSTPPRALSKDEIKQLVEKYIESAIRFKKAGFDGIEINSAHAHGLNTFLSPAWNHRTDEYGGSVENRSRMICEIIRGVKEACGKDFAIINLISAAEVYLKNGITLADACAEAKLFEAAGSDAIHVRYEIYLDSEKNVADRTSREVPDIALYPEHTDADLSEYAIDTSFGNGRAAWSGGAAVIKKSIDIPVICSGRMDAFLADELIAEQKIDFANLCRRTAADHGYANKIAAGTPEDIRPCVGCFTCYDMSERGLRSWCMVNPTLTELPEDVALLPGDSKKRVLVIGSGAAGLEAARAAALRGFDVTIVEQESALGGSLPLAALIKDFHEDFQAFSDWQVRQVEKLGIKTMLKTKADRAFVESVAPDAVIVAVGGAENIPDLPGIHKQIVMTGEELHKQLKTYTKVFSTKSLGKLSKIYLPLGKTAVLIGGGIHGIQTARFLMARGRHVIVVEESDEFGTGMLDCGPKPQLMKWVIRHGAELYKNVTYKEITDEGLVVVDADGNEKLLAADNVITTLPMLPNLALYDELKDSVPYVAAVGDCNPYIVEEAYPQMVFFPVETKTEWPRFTVTAVRQAYRAACAI